MTIEEWLGTDNQLGIDIWEKKYRFNNESFDEWLNRVSGGDKELQQLIVDKKFLFGGRILANRNITTRGKTYSNCYVVEPIEDSIESIYNTCGKLARTFSYGGGCGVDISKLRPRGAKVANAAQTTTGAVSFMQTISQVAETIGQHGRRGATMISISVDHPDVEEFIDCKTDLTKVTGANISVRVSDAFMQAVQKDKDYVLHWPCDFTGYPSPDACIEYDTLYSNILSGQTYYWKKVKARKLFNKLVANNWDYAEPGILYWDRISDWNIVSEDPNFAYAGTNPCAEEPLPAGGSCLLGSLNLAAFVDEENSSFQKDEFKKAIRIAVKALNIVLVEGLPLHPLVQQRNTVRDWRQIGLGVMGIADMLIKLHIRYDSRTGINFCKTISDILASEALDASADLACSGGAYPKFNAEDVLKSPYVQEHAYPETIAKIKQCGLYNSQLLTIAPTGSLSTMLQISGGIEPIFAMSYTRTTKSLHGKDQDYKVYTKIAQDWLKQNPGKRLPDYFVESSQILPEMRIKMQAVWQNAIDASISSTINLPESATKQDVYNIYMHSWEQKLKGVTVFRAGCKRVAILSSSSKDSSEKKQSNEVPQNVVTVTDPKNRVGKIRTLTTGCGTLHLTCFFDKYTGQLVETFFAKGSTGGCNNYMNGLSRMISLSAKKGATVNEIIDQLGSTGACPSYVRRTALQHDTSKGSCCAMAAGYAIKEMYDEMQSELGECLGISKDIKPLEEKSYTPPVKVKNVYKPTHLQNKCPECGNALNMTEGCMSCPNCGYSKCG